MNLGLSVFLNKKRSKNNNSFLPVQLPIRKGYLIMSQHRNIIHITNGKLINTQLRVTENFFELHFTRIESEGDLRFIAGQFLNYEFL